METDDVPSDEAYQAMCERTDELVAAFTESPQFEALTAHQQREAEMVLESVGEFLAVYEGVPIDDPDSRHLKTVCTVLYPAKVSAEVEHFSAVAPVLGSFLRFLDERGTIDDGEALATGVEDLQDDIVEAALNPANWGMAKSMVMGGEVDEAVELTTESPRTTEEVPEGTGQVLGEMDLGSGSGPEPAFSAAEEAAISEAFNSISADAEATLDEATAALVDQSAGDTPAAVFEHTDVTRHEMEQALNEVIEEAGIDTDQTRGDPDDSMVLTPDQSARFFDWYGKLLVDVNNRFDIVPGIDTYGEFARLGRDKTYPIREHLYTECPTAVAIEDFVAENPAALSGDALKEVERWKHFVTGNFVVLEHRETDTVFLDPDIPKAYAVTGLEFSFAETTPASDLPAVLRDIVLLPFEDTIVTDPWIRIDPLTMDMWDRQGIDIDATYADAKHRFGIVESLPAGGEAERSDAEDLRFYTKNADNRERYAEEIEALRDETEELARIYHEQLGKANARRLGREFRDLDLEEAYVAIYDGQVVATAPTEARLEETLSAILPDGKADHPYVYHYDPS